MVIGSILRMNEFILMEDYSRKVLCELLLENELSQLRMIIALNFRRSSFLFTKIKPRN